MTSFSVDYLSNAWLLDILSSVPESGQKMYRRLKPLGWITATISTCAIFKTINLEECRKSFSMKQTTFSIVFISVKRMQSKRAN